MLRRKLYQQIHWAQDLMPPKSCIGTTNRMMM